MAKRGWELNVPLPADEASQLCRRTLEAFQLVIESVDQKRIVAKEDWSQIGGQMNLTNFGRLNIEVLLAPVDDSETLVTLNGSMKGFGQPAKVRLREVLMLIAGNIANAAEQTADSGSSGQSKAVSDGAAGGAAASDPFEQLRQLSELRDAGVLTEEEFDAKKADLLRRI